MEQQEGRVERTPEEVAWDEEFADTNKRGLGADLRDLFVFAARLPRALIDVPMSIVPEETARHARAAALESFLAVRSLLSTIGDNIEDMLAGSGAADPAKGPEGTWGTGRATSSAKVKRIEVGGSNEIEPATGPGDMP
jgi:hypothetical protein